jgi:hypothetical protein
VGRHPRTPHRRPRQDTRSVRSHRHARSTAMESLHPSARRPAHPRIETHHADRTPGGKPMTFTPRLPTSNTTAGWRGSGDSASPACLRSPLLHARAVGRKSHPARTERILHRHSGPVQRGAAQEDRGRAPWDERRSEGSPDDHSQPIRAARIMRNPGGHGASVGPQFLLLSCAERMRLGTVIPCASCRRKGRSRPARHRGLRERGPRGGAAPPTWHRSRRAGARERSSLPR